MAKIKFPTMPDALATRMIQIAAGYERTRKDREATFKKWETFKTYALARMPNLFKRAFALRGKAMHVHEIEKRLGYVLNRLQADSFGSIYDHDSDHHMYLWSTKSVYNDAWQDLRKAEDKKELAAIAARHA